MLSVSNAKTWSVMMRIRSFTDVMNAVMTNANRAAEKFMQINSRMNLTRWNNLRYKKILGYIVMRMKKETMKNIIQKEVMIRMKKNQRSKKIVIER